MRKRMCVLCVISAAVSLLSSNFPGEAKKTAISYYIRNTDSDFTLINQLVSSFEKQNPNIDVKLVNNPDYASYVSKLLTMSAGGVAPDVVFLETGWYAPFADKGMLMDLTPLIKNDREFKLEDYWTVALKPWQRKSRLYSVPNDIARSAMFYNADMLRKYGIPVPPDNWDWDDFVELGKKATKDTSGDGRPDTYGTCYYSREVAVYQAGGRFFDDPYNPTKLVLDSPEGLAGLQWTYDLWKKYGVSNNQWGSYEAGKVAFFPFGRWNCPTYFKTLKFNWDMAPMPRGKQPGNIGDGSGYQIMSSTKHPKEAWEFVKFIGGYHGQLFNARQNWTTAANKKVALLDEILNYAKPARKNYAAFTADMEYSYVKLVHPSSTKIVDVLNASLDQFYAGKIGAKEAVSQAKGLVNQLLRVR